MLVEPDARTGLSQDGCERRLPDLERLTAEIIAAKFDQVEGVEEHSLVDPVMPQAVETGDAGLLITSDRLAVDDAGGRLPTWRRYAVGWSFLLFSLAFLGFLRGCDRRSSGLSTLAIMPVATRV